MLTLDRMEAVVFDIDGTLGDTASQMALGIKNAFLRLGFEYPTVEQVRLYVGNGVDLLVARSIMRNAGTTLEDVDPDMFSAAKEAYIKEYAKVIHRDFNLYDGVEDTLQSLKDTGFKLAVATNKPHEFVVPWLEASGLAKFFDYAIGGGLLSERKPHPMMLLKVCEELNVRPERTCMVGDSVNDVQCAKNAGSLSVGLTYGYNRGVPIKNCNPDFVLNSFRELSLVLI